MTAQEMTEQLSKVTPDTEIVGGMWNGRVDTYTMLDKLHVFQYDELSNDFFGTPGAFDDKLMTIKPRDVVYLGSLFESQNNRVIKDRSIIWRMRKILSMHRSKDWKKERIYQLLTDFAKSDFKNSDL